MKVWGLDKVGRILELLQRLGLEEALVVRRLPDLGVRDRDGQDLEHNGEGVKVVFVHREKP